jgi:DNA-binding transcriptional regulator LsrR (DeoR family)
VAEVASIERRWFSLKLAHLKAISDRSRRSGTPGVVCIAIGSGKAPVVAAAIQHGILEHLFIDYDLAFRLNQCMHTVISVTTSGKQSRPSTRHKRSR